MYRGTAVLFGAKEMEARNPALELGPPCIEGPLYYLAQRRAEGWKEERRGEADLR